MEIGFVLRNNVVNLWQAGQDGGFVIFTIDN